MSKPIDQAITLLIGREPTSDEVAKFYQIKEVCGFSDHDSVWSILLAFGHYEILYGEIAEKLQKNTTQLLVAHKDALEATATAAERVVKSNLADSVARVARDLAQQAIQEAGQITLAKSRSNFIVAGTLSFGVATILLSACAWIFYSLGANSVTADASWAISREGKAARQFASLNDVVSMTDCGTNFQQRNEGNKTFCVPYDDKAKKISGWRIN